MKKIKNINILTCSPDETIKNTLKKINKNLTGTIFVISNNKILGSVTDGDIRRYLLKDHNLNDKVRVIMNKNFIYIKSIYDKKIIDKIVKKYQYRCRIFPVLDKKKNLKNFINQESIPIYKPSLFGNEAKYLHECVAKNWISSGGKFVTKFENKFSKLHQNRHALSVSNATNGLHLSLVALGIKKNDEVIIPNLTFAAVINAVLYIGAKPILVDVDKNKWTIDVNEIKKNISKKTRAIIPVHLFGNPCNLSEIIRIAKKNNLLIIEDCAEAIGSKYNTRPVGVYGDCGVFSFFGNKTITTGEGGMIIFKNKHIYEKAKQLRDHGMSLKKKYYHELIGYNYRMTNMQAAVGVAQLEKFKKIIKKKIDIEKMYRKFLSKENIIFQKDENLSINSYWAVGVLVDKIDFNYNIFYEKMKIRGIETRNFFYPLNKQKIYKRYAIKKKYSTDNLYKKGILLPTHPFLKRNDIKFICEQIMKSI